MDYRITTIEQREYPAVVELWEASVRATHDFLPEADIRYFRPLILNEYLDAVDLRAAREDGGAILGFVGVADRKVEMLFIDPGLRGQGIGTALLDAAVSEFGAGEVDVNEQNPDAVGFYEFYGFEVVGRSPVDGLGKPYPILHLRLNREG